MYKPSEDRPAVDDNLDCKAELGLESSREGGAKGPFETRASEDLPPRRLVLSGIFGN